MGQNVTAFREELDDVSMSTEDTRIFQIVIKLVNM